MNTHPLQILFEPSHIAVIGASDRPYSVGHTVMANLLSAQSKMRITPINVRHKRVAGMKAYAGVRMLRQKVDLAVVVTEPRTYSAIVQDCYAAHIPHILLISSRQEITDIDRHAVQEALQLAQQYNIRVLGPSLLGLARPATNFNAGTYRGRVKEGNVALISQSSSLCSAILDQASDIGFSTVLLFGDQPQSLGFGEVLDFLVHDSATDAIVLHMYQDNNGRHLMSALCAAARVKPVVVMKSGRSRESDETIPSSDQVFAQAMKQSGVLQVRTVNQLFQMIRMFSYRLQPQGDRLAIVCNGSGLGLISADAAMDQGIHLAELTEKTRKELAQTLPQTPMSNPLDLHNDAGALRYRSAAQLFLEDEQTDAVLVVFSPQTDSDESLKIAEMMLQLIKQHNKPLIPVWIGADKTTTACQLFRQHRCICFESPDEAVEMFRYLVRGQVNRDDLRHTFVPEQKVPCYDLEKAHHYLIQNDIFSVLSCFGLQINAHPEVAHYQLTITRDALFGVVFRISSDAEKSELFLPDLRYMPENFAHINHIVRCLADLAAEMPQITMLQAALDSSGKIIAQRLNWLLNDNPPPARYEHFALMPYPRFLEQNITLKNQQTVFIRPIRPGDCERVQNFVRALSDGSRYNRFMMNIKELSDEMLARFTRLDYDRDMALMMIDHDNVLGIARYFTDADMLACEFAVSVSDHHQGKGIGTIMMNSLFHAARHQGLKTMRGEVLVDNASMLALMRKVGFTVRDNPQDHQTVIVEKDLVQKP